MITPSIRVLLVDDHAIVREGLRTLLSEESDLEVVGEAGDGVESVNLVAILQPYVVLMDLVMPGMDGIQAMRNLRVVSPSGHVSVILSKLGVADRTQAALYAVKHGLGPEA